MTLIKHNPIADYKPTSFSGFLDRFYNDLWNDQELERFSPAVDVIENDKNFEIQVAVPGMKKDDFNIEVEDNNLIISGERKFEKEDSDNTYHTVENQYGYFKRTFNLPDIVNVDKIDAKYQDGILKLTLPKDEKKTQKSKIKVN